MIGGSNAVCRVFEDQTFCWVGIDVGCHGEEYLGRGFDVTDVVRGHNRREVLNDAVLGEPAVDPFAVATRANGQRDAVLLGVGEQIDDAGAQRLRATVFEQTGVVVCLPVGAIDGPAEACFEGIEGIKPTNGAKPFAPFGELEDDVVGLPHFVDDHKILGLGIENGPIKIENKRPNRHAFPRLGMMLYRTMTGTQSIQSAQEHAMNHRDGGVIAVTGGAHRLGAAIVRRAAQQQMRVAIHYHQAHTAAVALAADIAQQGGEVLLHRADFAVDGAAAGFVDAVTAHYGRLDVLVNNAGIWGHTPTETVTATDFRRFQRINVEAAFEAIQRATPWLAAQFGAVINMCDAGVYRPWRHYAPYLASKGALVQLTHTMALELAPQIRVNGVAPGLALVPDDWDAERIAKACAQIPLRRPGTADDVAEAVLYLARARYVTGVVLPVDGGVTQR